MRLLLLAVVLMGGCSIQSTSLLELHNSSRQEPLSIDERLMDLAQEHAEWMARWRWMRHQPMGRIQRVGYTHAGENIARAGSAQEAFEMWMDSPGHRRNILQKRFRYMGYGNSGRYWCVCFGG